MLSRRTLLGGGASAIGTAALGACASGPTAGPTGNSRLNWNYERLCEFGEVPIYGLAWSPDGEFIAANGAGDSLIGLWHVASKRQVWVLHKQRLPNSTRSLCFTLDGRYLITSEAGLTNRGGLSLVDVRTGKPVHSIDPPPGHLAPAGTDRGLIWGEEHWALSPDGKYLISTPTSNASSPSAAVYDAQDWSFKRIITLQNYAFRAFAFDPTRSGVVATQSIWFSRYDLDGPLAGKFKRDPDLAGVEFWDVGLGELIRYFPVHPGGVGALVFVPDSQILLTASGSYRFPSPPSVPSWLADPDNSEQIRAWDSNTGKKIRGFHSALDVPFDLAIDSTKRFVAALSLNRGLVIWDFRSGELLGREYPEGRRFLPPMLRIAFQPGTDLLAFARNNEIYVGSILRRT